VTKQRSFAFALVAGLALVAPARAHAQTESMIQMQNQIDQLTRKVEELEQANQQVHGLDQRVQMIDRKMDLEQQNARAAQTRASRAPSVESSAKGFFVHSQDESYSLRIGGWLQSDGRFYTTDTKPTGSEFLIRRLRPYLDGTVAKYYDFRFLLDFAQGTTTLQDAFTDLHYWPGLRLRAGKFKELVGLERIQDDRYVKFVERALPSQLVPDRDIGFALHGVLLDQRMEYSVGLFNGTFDNTATVAADHNDAKDIAGRVYFHPFAGSDPRYAAKLGLGLAATYGDERGATLDTYRSAGQTVFFTYAKGVSASGPRYRIAPQFDYYRGPFGLLGEYVDNTQRMRLTGFTGTTRPRPYGNLPRKAVSDQAWQLTAAWLLTGEDNSFDAIVPRRDFNPFGGGLGAWELVGRAGQLLIDRSAFTNGFASSTTSTREAIEWALGVNWYLNPNVKAQLDYSRTAFTAGASDGHDLPNESVILSEMQLQF